MKPSWTARMRSTNSGCMNSGCMSSRLRSMSLMAPRSCSCPSTDVDAGHESGDGEQRAPGGCEPPSERSGVRRSAAGRCPRPCRSGARAQRAVGAAILSAGRRGWRARLRPGSPTRSQRRRPRSSAPATAGGGDQPELDTRAPRRERRRAGEDLGFRRRRTGVRTIPRPRNPRGRVAPRRHHPGRRTAPDPPADQAIHGGDGRRCRPSGWLPRLRLADGYRFSRRLQTFFARPWATLSS